MGTKFLLALLLVASVHPCRPNPQAVVRGVGLDGCLTTGTYSCNPSRQTVGNLPKVGTPLPRLQRRAGGASGERRVKTVEAKTRQQGPRRLLQLRGGCRSPSAESKAHASRACDATKLQTASDFNGDRLSSTPDAQIRIAKATNIKTGTLKSASGGDVVCSSGTAGADFDGGGSRESACWPEAGAQEAEAYAERQHHGFAPAAACEGHEASETEDQCMCAFCSNAIGGGHWYMTGASSLPCPPDTN